MESRKIDSIYRHFPNYFPNSVKIAIRSDALLWITHDSNVDNN
jgi:hypothetical protein